MSDTATPKLVTIPNIEICEVGEEWQLSTGPLTLTPEHIASAVEAPEKDAAVHHPRVRFGHTLDWPVASEPAFGRYINLRAENEGMTLVGDLAGVPEWFDEILPAAFPNRSMDGWTDVTTHTGNVWPLIIEAVSFLGVVLPGINTLEDLAAVWASEPPEGTQVQAGTPIHATRGGAVMAKPAAAAVGTDDLRKEFYNEFAQGDRYWWWIRQTFLDPELLIVDDDEGSLWALEYTVNASDGTVEFGEPQEVVTQYVYKETGKVAAAAARIQAGTDADAVYESVADSRPQERQKEAIAMDRPKATKAATLTVDREAVIKRLGLAEDATDEDITTALAEEAPEPEPKPGDTPAPDDTDDVEDTSDDDEKDDEPDEGDDATATVTVPKREWEAQQATTKRLEAESTKRESERRDGVVAGAIKDGRIARAHKDAWRKKFDVDPKGVETMLTASEDKGGLPKNLVPVNETGADGQGEGDEVAAATDDAQEAYYNTHFPELAQDRA